MRLLRQLVLDIKSRPKAHLAIALVVVSNQISFVALAAAPSSSLILDRSVRAAALCKAELECAVMAANDEAHVAVPAGAQRCPASGEGAACSSTGGVGDATPGVGSTPDGIYDRAGQLVAPACKSGSSCSANVTLTSSNTPYFSAVIGAEPPVNPASTIGQLLRTVAGPAPLVDIQTRSSAIQPTRVLWGVDSCKAFTSSPTATDGIYPQVASRFGAPDFWGRYLTNTACPGISPTEVAAAAHLHMGILPIYNDYNCSNVVSYATGQQYAAEATGAAASIGIPRGRALAIDIEPPGDQCPGAAGVDAAFVQGWYDGVAGAAYVPAYYGNGTAGTEFASAWCAAVSAEPALATYSYLWSFQPSLLGTYSKATAPGYRPYEPGCAGHVAAWQYQIDSSMSGHSDVDHDEALSTLPLWYPSGASN